MLAKNDLILEKKNDFILARNPSKTRFGLKIVDSRFLSAGGQPTMP